MERISIDYAISNDKIKVESSSTIFIKIVRKKAIDVNQLEKDIKEIRKICKERKIIFSQKNGLYKFFKDNKNNYLEETKKVDKLFDELLNGWQEKVQKGIYPGYSEDEELNNLSKIEWQIDKFYYAGTTISQINSLYNNVKSIYTDLKREDVTIKKIVL